MAYVGVVVPGIPFSIFLVFAAYCFAKSSKKWHDWLYNHKYFGPFLTNWVEKKVFPTWKAIPDGAGEFSRKMGFLVDKTNIGFGMRSWRYAAVVDDGVIEHFFIEPGFCDNADDDPFVVSDVDTVTRWLTEKKRLYDEARG